VDTRTTADATFVTAPPVLVLYSAIFVAVALWCAAQKVFTRYLRHHAG
jgi:hypothetical protein